MVGQVSIEELARRTGEPIGHLRKWRSLGLIGAKGVRSFALEDVESVRLVRLLLRRGVGMEPIQEAAKAGQLGRRLAGYLEWMYPGEPGPTYSVGEAAEELGLSLDLLRRVLEVSGLREEGEPLDHGDIEALRRVRLALEAGFPEEALVQLLRVYADAVGRAAEAAQRLFHFYVHEPLKIPGAEALEVLDRVGAIAKQTQPLVEPTILHFHRRAFLRALREDIVMDLAQQAGVLEKSEVPGQMRAAVVFVDLCSFTPLAEAMGDVTAAQVLERFSDVARQSAGRWGGRVVKQIGDAFMLVFTEVRSAVACALEIEGRTAEEPQFPALRSGIHWGLVLYREGDYVGSNVNIASRLATEAERHQVLVTAEVSREARGLTEVEFVPLGKRQLKGVGDELELFEARPRAVPATEKAVDPVCGMELSPAEVAARLALEGKERVFCSEECLRRFVATPERYSS
jgi:class 3 adenylate cyclase